MKRIVISFLLVALLLSMTACGKKEESKKLLSPAEIYEANIGSVVRIDDSSYGFVVSEDGHILAYGASGKDEVEVEFADGTTYVGECVHLYEYFEEGYDDYANSSAELIKIEADDLKPFEFGDPEKSQVGDEIMVIGWGYTDAFIAYNCIIGAIDDVEVDTLYDTDGSVKEHIYSEMWHIANDGVRIGAPVFNMYGEVVAVGDFSRLGYSCSRAIPISELEDALAVVDDYIKS